MQRVLNYTFCSTVRGGRIRRQICLHAHRCLRSAFAHMLVLKNTIKGNLVYH